MAPHHPVKTHRRATRPAPGGDAPRAFGKQLDAYLEAREALRRARATALLASALRSTSDHPTH